MKEVIIEPKFTQELLKSLCALRGRVSIKILELKETDQTTLGWYKENLLTPIDKLIEAISKPHFTFFNPDK